MVQAAIRRSLASVMLCVIAFGGGGMPALDALVFHGPTRLVESLHSHYEASSSCHSDGCSIRSDAQPRVLGDLPPQAPAAIMLEHPEPVRSGESVPRSSITLRYLSRAPPSVA